MRVLKASVASPGRSRPAPGPHRTKRKSDIRLRLARLMAATLVLSVVGFAGCQQEEHDPDLVAAFEVYTGAIKARDAGKLWDLSPAALHEKFDKLYAELADVVESVKEEYPGSDRDAALQNLAAKTLSGVSSGKELFIALLALDKLPAGDAVTRGLEIASTRLTGQDGTVTTRSGETFVFVREGEQWRCNTLLSQLDSYPSLRTLQQNMETARSNLETWSKAKEETTDRSKPEGTLNILARATRRDARVMVYEMLDKPSREQLDKAAAAAKTYVKAVTQKFPKKDDRAAYLTGRKFAWILRATTPKTMFVELWDAGAFADLVPPKDEFVIKSVDSQGADFATVNVTVGDKPLKFDFRMHLNRWAFASLEPAVISAGLRAVEREQRELSTAAP